MPEESEQGSRRSNAVTLTLVGVPMAVLLAANLIPEGQKMRRNVYVDRAACERDYPPQQCEPDTSSGSTGSDHSSSGYHSSYHGWYHGPYYHADRTSAAARSDPGPGRTGTGGVSYQTTTRGGFGAFGRAVRAVG
jgi:hypothetical protein